ncbi:unnamed protein product [Nippostrongylus brasiliensis]|uniref:SCP domain-containing protein n=1 Tax=Nippostrongylus brasiliensis TaxID=27835 RepID=A0A0N4Y5V6_NIPBR|nr:unnamed protein product [Nippostrongylus brasiliensis]
MWQRDGALLLLLAVVGGITTGAIPQCMNSIMMSDIERRILLEDVNRLRREAAIGLMDSFDVKIPKAENMYKVVSAFPPWTGKNHKNFGFGYGASVDMSRKRHVVHDAVTRLFRPEYVLTEGHDKNDEMLNFLNLIRGNTTRIGCSQQLCQTLDGYLTATGVCYFNSPSELALGRVVKETGQALPHGANILQMKEAQNAVRRCADERSGPMISFSTAETLWANRAEVSLADVTNKLEAVQTSKKFRRSSHGGNKLLREINSAFDSCSGVSTYISRFPNSHRGNIVDHLVYAKGTPCSMCPFDTTCDPENGLCVQSL